MRRAIRLLGYGLLAALCLYLAGFAANVVHVFAHDRPEVLPAGAVLVVLGAGQNPDGSLRGAGLQRVEAAAELYRTVEFAQVVLTGGSVVGESRPVAASMAETITRLGVPAGRQRIETRSLSTLQNALLTRALFPGEAPAVVVVTQRFHLARAWASFRWAGFGDVIPYAANERPPDVNARFVRRMAWEALKWPPNLARAGAASAAAALGVPEARFLPLLD